MSLKNLYRQVVLEHSRRPRWEGDLPEATHAEGGHNPACGDSLRLMLRVEGGIIEEARFTAQGCAISTASADLMAGAVRGKTLGEALALEQAFTHMIRTGEAAPELGDSAALVGIHDLPTRVKCAMLAWQTLKVALNDSDSAQK